MEKLLFMLLVLLLLPALTLAQGEMVSIAELRAQVQEMSRWTQSYEVDGNTVDIDAPIRVPDVSQLPVLTVEIARPFTREQYDAIMDGEPHYDTGKELNWTMPDGQTLPSSFSLGADSNYNPLPSFDERYLLAISVGTSVTTDLGYPTPHSFHYAWEIPFDEPLVRGSPYTLEDVTALWQSLLDMFYPEQNMVIVPHRVSIFGSTLSNQKTLAGDESRPGHYWVEGVQLLCGVPVLGSLWQFGQHYVSTNQTDKKIRSMRAYHLATERLREYQSIQFRDNQNYQSRQVLLSVRSVLHEDIPLAPLEDVLAALEAEIEKGTLRDVFALRLGYLLYADPGVTEYVYAVPGWIAECQYVAEKNRKTANLFAQHADEQPDGAIVPPWSDYTYSVIPIGAQSAQTMIFDIADETVLTVPKIITWEDVQ